MKTEKIEQMIIKDYHKSRQIVYSKYNDNVVVIARGATVAYIIPESIFLFDFAKISNGKEFFGSFDKWFNNQFYSKAKAQFEEFKVTKNRKILIKFTNNSECVYVDAELLGLFENYMVHIAGPNSPVKIYEGDRLVGLVMPTHVE